MNIYVFFFSSFILLGNEQEEKNSLKSSLYVVNTPLEGKGDQIIEQTIAQMVAYARQFNYQGISISPTVLPLAERYIPYSNTGEDILIFDHSDKKHAIQVHSTLHPKKLEFDVLVDDAELNILNWCMSRHVDYSSALLCTRKSSNTVIAAALVDHNFNINDTRLHTLYTAKKARNNGYASELLNCVIRLGIMNRMDTISLYAASVGEENYRVNTSTLLSLYKKNGFKQQYHGYEMYGQIERMKVLTNQNPSEKVILLFSSTTDN